MRLGIIVAMEKELERLSSITGPDIRITLSGIGKVNAAIAAHSLINEFNPDAIISIGVSGSMHSHLRQGDIIVGNRVAYHDVWCGEGHAMGQAAGQPQFFECDGTLSATLARGIEELLVPDDKVPGMHRGLLTSGDQFYISREEDARILRLYPEALAADMESAAIAHVCSLTKTPYAVLRVISDTHGSDSEHQKSYEDFWASHNRAFSIITKVIGKL